MKKTKILIILLIAIFGIFICSKVYAEGGNNADFIIFDKNGKAQGVGMPGADGTYYDVSLDYTESYSKIYLYETKENCQYEETFTIDNFGTFNFEKIGASPYGDYEQCLIYKADNIDINFLNEEKDLERLSFKVKNITTDEYEEFNTASYDFFKDQFESNANLSVNGIDIIKDGKALIKDGYIKIDRDIIATYSRAFNIMFVYAPYRNTVKYNNMGENFEIYTDSEQMWIQNTELLVSGNLPTSSKVEVKSLTSGDIYNNAVNSLGEGYKNIKLYDISLININTGEKMQPEEKLKFYIPVPEGANKENLEIYRIEENGEKVKYDTTLIDRYGVEYVVFETDHLSTYAMAEKVAQNNAPTEQQEEKKQHILDDEPKAGYNEMKKIALTLVAVIATAGITVYLKNLIKNK